jgi:anaerobic magnesium-protoporphyrin IX monomethyl ester cyclase
MQLDAIFINGPFLEGFSRESRSPAVTKSGTLYYPAWLAYACGMAEDNGFECSLIDSIADKISFEESVEIVVSSNPKIVVIGTSTPSIEADLDFAKAIKEKLDKTLTILVGTHASSVADQIIHEYDFIDIVARREYDLTILELLKCIKAGKEWNDVPGITYRLNGIAKANVDMPYIKDLDVLPFGSKVYSKHLTIKNYYYGHIRYPMVSIFTSRGCNARCNFCLYPQTMFGNFRERSPKNIADEFLWISKNMPEVKEVLIDDDTFTMNKKHAVKVAQEMIKNKNKLLWTCESRATLDYETLSLMKKAGCKLVVTGFESISQEVLNKINKGIKFSNVDAFVDSAKKAGVKIHACFMAGNPGDTKETLNATLQWALKKNFDTAQFFPLQVYPGTKAFDWAKETGYLKKQNYRDWVTPSGMHNMTILKNDTGLTAQECLDFCDYARRKFYLRPGYITKKVLQGIIQPQEFKKNLKGFLKIYKHLFRKVSKELQNTEKEL